MIVLSLVLNLNQFGADFILDFIIELSPDVSVKFSPGNAEFRPEFTLDSAEFRPIWC